MLNWVEENIRDFNIVYIIVIKQLIKIGRGGREEFVNWFFCDKEWLGLIIYIKVILY